LGGVEEAFGLGGQGLGAQPAEQGVGVTERRAAAGVAEAGAAAAGAEQGPAVLQELAVRQPAAGASANRPAARWASPSVSASTGGVYGGAWRKMFPENRDQERPHGGQSGPSPAP
jgi:hypothetical protein